MNLKETDWKFERAMETERKIEENLKEWRKWIIGQFKKQIWLKFEKHEDIWKKLEENYIREICEMFVKNMKNILKLERNSNDILEK